MGLRCVETEDNWLWFRYKQCKVQCHELSVCKAYQFTDTECKTKDGKTSPGADDSYVHFSKMNQSQDFFEDYAKDQCTSKREASN